MRIRFHEELAREREQEREEARQLELAAQRKAAASSRLPICACCEWRCHCCGEIFPVDASVEIPDWCPECTAVECGEALVGQPCRRKKDGGSDARKP